MAKKNEQPHATENCACDACYKGGTPESERQADEWMRWLHRHLGAHEMTKEQQEQVLADFAVWSGGFTPQESDDLVLYSYATTARPSDLDEQEVYEFLKEEHARS
jgi:hypothetical protein